MKRYIYCWVFPSLSQLLLQMSSVEDSDKEGDSLDVEEEKIFRVNRMPRQKGHRGVRHNQVEDALYHEAFRLYMFGGFKKASQKCKNIIALNPENPKPYFLLGSMHEEAAKNNNDSNDLHKAVEYFFFDAFYSSPEIDKWVKVAEMSQQLEIYLQAAYCYGRALKMNNLNLQLSLRRAQCLQKCNEGKKARNIYQRIIKKVSNSVQVYKKYARLLFKAHDYTKARSILQAYPMMSQDPNIKYMICQTLLKDRKYTQLYSFMQEMVIQHSDYENIYNDLAIPFIQMLLICAIACPYKAKQISTKKLWEELKQQYQEQSNPQIYQQLIEHTHYLNSQKCYEYTQYLLKYPAHQSVGNYMMVSQHLRQTNQLKDALIIIQDGIKKHKNLQSQSDLRVQFNYLQALQKKKKGRNTWIMRPKQSLLISKNNVNQQKQDDQIFQSDQEFENKRQQQHHSKNLKDKRNDQLLYSEDNIEQEEQCNAKNHSDEDYLEEDEQSYIEQRISKNKRIRKNRQETNNMKYKDPSIVQTLINNTLASLSTYKEQFEGTKGVVSSSQALKQIMPNVKSSLAFIAELEGNRKKKTNQKKEEFEVKRGIFQPKSDNKRKRGSEGENRLNFIRGNQEKLVQSIKIVLFFMKQQLKQGNFEDVLNFAQILSHSYFFKWQNKIAQFKDLKVQVYEIAISACLSLKKYKKSLFFLRYLINKFPENPFYLTMIEKVTRLGLGKLTLNYYIKKDMMDENSSNQTNLLYLRAIQEMDNSFFELALTMFTKVLNNLQNTAIMSCQNENMMKIVYLCMSTCFLQLASSRTVFNKLDFVNRSAVCFAKYKQYALKGGQQEQIYIQFNKGRWFSHIRAYRQATECYKHILQKQQSILQRQSGLNTMIIGKEIEDYEGMRQISEKYLFFPSFYQ